MKQRRLSILLLALMGLLAVPSIAGPPGVSIVLVPSATFVPPGGSVDIDVVISGLGNLAAPSLGTFDLDLQFDPAVFSFNSIAFGLELGDPMAGEAITGSMAVGGSLNAFEVSLLLPAALISSQPDGFTVFTATFDAAAPGTGPFDVTVNALGDELGMPLAVAPIVPVSVGSGSLGIPSLGPTGVLLLSLLLLAAGLVFLRRMG